jgi:signal transduction histidine kinase
VERARDRVLQKLPAGAVENVAFTLQAEKDVPEIFADASALEEVFFNLILNAYEAMPRGGKLKVNVKSLNSAVSITFTDTGVGIHSRDLGDIFNPFFTSKTTGAGMGLSKVYLLIEEHRGTVEVTSEPKKGSTFEVILPVERLMTSMSLWETVSRGGVLK